MAKASATITVSLERDISSVTRYYKLQASTASAPAKPTTLTPSGWTTTEPAYTEGSTNSLYFTDCTVFTDGTFSYSDVSLSSSYEAAKAAYNRAVEAARVATRYISDTSSDGLIVHPENDSTTGWRIKDALEMLKSGISFFKAWVENSVAKVRIGREDEGHILIDSLETNVYGGDGDVVASFGERVVIGNELSNNSYLYLSNQGFEVYLDQQKQVFYIGHGFERISDLDNTVSFSSTQGDGYYPSSFEYDEYINTEEIGSGSSLGNVENLKYDLVLGVVFQYTYEYTNSLYETSTVTESKSIQIPFTPSARGSEYSFTVAQEIISSRFGERTYTTKVRHVITIDPMTTEISVSNDSQRVINIGFYKCDYHYKIPIDNPSFTFGTRTSDVDEGEFSFAVGSDVQATYFCSYAEGIGTKSSGRASHAEGLGATASGVASHAEGYYSKATGDYSHAEAHGTASGNYSHAEGLDTTAGGRYSHAQNIGTKAGSEAQTVIGKFNVEDTNDEYALIVGNGARDQNRSNALTVDWDGNVNATGTIKQNGTAVSLSGHIHVGLFAYEDVTVSVTYAAGTIGSRGASVALGTTVKTGYTYIGAVITDHRNTSVFSATVVHNGPNNTAHLAVYRATGNAASNLSVIVRKVWVLSDFATS